MKHVAWDFVNDQWALDWLSVSIPAAEKAEPSPYNDMIDWCKQSDSDGIFYPCIVAGNITFFFSQESDAVLFRLRW